MSLAISYREVGTALKKSRYRSFGVKLTKNALRATWHRKCESGTLPRVGDYWVQRISAQGLSSSLTT
jgi:hypothetical protein